MVMADKMNYYILKQDDRILEQPSVMSVSSDIDPLEWIDGKILMSPPPPARLSMSPRSSKFRGAIIGGLVTLFHQRFIDELTRLGVDNIQYFPVELENPEGKIETTYSLVNVVGLLKAVDVQASDIEDMGTGGRGHLKSFKIDPAATKGQRIFRIVEAPSLIIIDETLQNNFLTFELPGVIMLPTERYDGW